MIRAGAVQALHGLEDESDGRGDAFGREELGNLGRDFLVAEGRVDFLDVVLVGAAIGRLDFLIDLADNAVHAALLEEGEGSLEGDELVHARHVDAVVVGVANLRGRGDDNHAARVEAVEDADDALAEGRSAHDAVVDDDEVVHARL